MSVFGFFDSILQRESEFFEDLRFFHSPRFWLDRHWLRLKFDIILRYSMDAQKEEEKHNKEKNDDDENNDN